MIIILQSLVFALVGLSFILVLIIPIVLASSGGWEKSKSLLFASSGIWAGIVIITGVLNSFA
nr:Ycf9 [Cavernulicola chilensis]